MDEPALTLAHVSLRRRNRLHAAAALLLILAAPPAVVVLAVSAGILPLAALAPLSLLSGILLWSANPGPRERLGQLVAGEIGLFFDGRRLVARSAVRGGRLVLDPGDAPLVRLSTARGPIEIRVASPLAGEALLLALGTGEGRAHEMRLASRVYADPTAFAQVTLIAVLFPFLCGAIGFALHAHVLAAAALGVVAAAAALFVVVTLMAPTRLSLEEGGVTVSWLGRRRFLRADELDAVRTWQAAEGAFGGRVRRGISIFLRSGEALRFALAGDEGDAETMVGRLREALGPRPLPAAAYREAPALEDQGADSQASLVQ
jgi:hypothetical protein